MSKQTDNPVETVEYEETIEPGFMRIKKVSGLKPQDASSINKRNYDRYVAHLKKSKKRFPVNQWGDINVQGIAKICGFDRQVFDGKIMKTKLLNDCDTLGTEVSRPKNNDSELAKKAKRFADELNKERKANALNEEKIASLEKKVMELRAEVAELKNRESEADESLNHMIATGRRFSI